MARISKAAIACLILYAAITCQGQPTLAQTIDETDKPTATGEQFSRHLLQRQSSVSSANAQAGSQGGHGSGSAAATASATSRQQQQPWFNRQQPFFNINNDIPSILNSAVVSGRSEAAASAIATAGSRGQATAAAETLTSQIGAGRVDTVAEAVAQASARNTAATATVLAQTATRAKARGFLNQFARSQARAFVAARRRGKIANYADAVAEAIAVGGAEAGRAYGVAFARAAAGTDDEQQALAEATAVAFCQGGKKSRAFAQAYAEALSRDSRTGCLVLSRARAIAVAKCRGGVASTYAKATAESRVLGFCRQSYPYLPELANFNFDRVTESGFFRLGNLLSGVGGLFG